MAHIRIVDLPCGYGKSTRILNDLRKGEKYIAVVPYLSEVQRFINDAYSASDFILTEPVSAKDTKSDHCERLLRAGKSIATTHALFFRLGTLATLKTGVVSCTSFAGDGTPKIEVGHLLDDTTSSLTR